MKVKEIMSKSYKHHTKHYTTIIQSLHKSYEHHETIIHKSYEHHTHIIHKSYKNPKQHIETTYSKHTKIIHIQNIYTKNTNNTQTIHNHTQIKHKSH